VRCVRRLIRESEWYAPRARPRRPHDVGDVRHGFHSTRHHHVRLAELDRLRAQHDRLHPRCAHLTLRQREIVAEGSVSEPHWTTSHVYLHTLDVDGTCGRDASGCNGSSTQQVHEASELPKGTEVSANHTHAARMRRTLFTVVHTVEGGHPAPVAACRAGA
jgi:hypothetical protein